MTSEAYAEGGFITYWENQAVAANFLSLQKLLNYSPVGPCNDHVITYANKVE